MNVREVLAAGDVAGRARPRRDLAVETLTDVADDERFAPVAAKSGAYRAARYSAAGSPLSIALARRGPVPKPGVHQRTGRTEPKNDTERA